MNGIVSRVLSICLLLPISLSAFATTYYKPNMGGGWHSSLMDACNAHASRHDEASNGGTNSNCIGVNVQNRNYDFVITSAIDGGWIASVRYYAVAKTCEAGEIPDASGNCDTGPQNDGDSQCKNPSPMFGNPINSLVGNKFQKVVDIPKTGTSPIEFIRHYNSNSYSTGKTGGFSSYWRHNYERRVVLSLTEDEEIWADLYRPGGKRIIYTLNNSEWVGDPSLDLSWTTDVDGNPTSWTLSNDDYIETYNGEGQLLSIQYPKKNTSITLSYLSQGLIDQVSDNLGNSLTFAYVGTRDIASVSHSNGTIVNYSYTTSPKTLSQVHYDDNTTETYHYESSVNNNLLTGITDRRGVRYAEWVYDSNRRAYISRHFDDAGNAVEEVTIDYTHENDATDPRVTITNALGKQTTLHYTTVRGIRKISEVEGHVSNNCAGANKSYTYLANGLINTKTDWAGNTTQYFYNDRNLQTTKVEALGTASERTTTKTWHPTLDLPASITRGELTTRYTYNANGQVLTRTEEAGSEARTTTYTYNADGLVETINGERTDVLDQTTLSYDAYRNLVQTENALGHIRTFANHNARGQAQSIIDENGVQTLLQYHPRGWLLSSTIVHPSGNPVQNQVTTYAYDAVGQLVSVTLPDQQQLSYEYDAARRLTAIENILGERTEFTYDAASNNTSEQKLDSNGQLHFQVMRAYDELNRVMNIVGNNGQNTHIDYDVNNNVEVVTDGKNNPTSFQYDALNRVVQTLDPYLNASESEYDENGRLTTFADQRELQTQYDYDGFGNLISINSPDTGSTTHQYDEAGNLILKSDSRGVVTEYTYDALNRLLTVSYPASPSENLTYVYDETTNNNFGVGRLTRIVGTNSELHLDYDFMGRIIRRTSVVRDQQYVTSYAFNDLGQLTQMAYPSGRIVHYAYDVSGRVETIETQAQAGSPLVNIASNISYLPYGPVSGFVLGDSYAHQYSFDLDYRLTQISVVGAQTLMDQQYSYDLNNNITNIDFANPAFQNQLFNYDALNRLVDAEGGYGFINYEYDEVGNRLVREIQSESDLISEIYGYAVDSNQLENISIDDGGTLTLRNFSYDNAGNLISDNKDASAATITYDNANRPSLWQSDNASVIYEHNALGQRTIKHAISSGIYSLTTLAEMFEPAGYNVLPDATWESLALTLYGSEPAAGELQNALSALGYSTAAGTNLIQSDLPSVLSVSLPASDTEEQYTLNTSEFVDTETQTQTLYLDVSQLTDNDAGPLSYSVLNGVTELSGTVFKTNANGNSDGDFQSSEMLLAGTDGWVDFRINDTLGLVSLGLGNASDDAQQLPYRFRLENGVVSIYENGLQVNINNAPPIRIGDVLTIERTNSVVNYQHNGNLLHTSSQTSSQDLVVKGSFYYEMASANIVASFAGGVSCDAYYEVQSGDTWATISASLYGNSEGSDELSTSLGNPTLTVGSQLSRLPLTLEDDEAIVNVPAYYPVPENSTWQTIAASLYEGNSGVANELQNTLGATYSLIAGEQLLQSDLQATITVITPAPSTDYALDSSALSTTQNGSTVPAYYQVPANATWESVSLELYGTELAAGDLEQAIGLSLTLSEGETILGSELPNPINVVDLLPPVDYALDNSVITPTHYAAPASPTWADLAEALYGTTSVAGPLQTELTALGYTLSSDMIIVQSDLPTALDSNSPINQVTHFVYTSNGQLQGEYDDQGQLIAEYIWFGNSLMAKTQPADTLYFVHNDHLNTPQFMTDSDNAVVWQVVSQTPFGEVVVNDDPDGNGDSIVMNVRFPGQYFDEETNTNYNWHRTYDSSIGRYLQSDPLGLTDGPNTYQYAHLNPIANFDPDGRLVFLGVLPFIGGGAASTTAGGLGFWGTGALLGLGVVAATIPGDTPKEDDKDREHKEYHRVCDENPPPNLDKCELMRWKINQLQQCISLREQWDAKWGGDHSSQINQKKKELKKWKRRLENSTCEDKDC